MSRLHVVLILGALVAWASGYPSQLKYNVGDQFAYNLHGTLDARGDVVTTGQRTSGSYSTMDSVLVTQCQQEDDDSYLFVMNMFNTQVNVGQGDFLVARSLWERQTDDDDDDCSNCLGYDMYYQQKKTGEVVKIWYNTADSPYFVNVKVGAINAFQTHLVGPNQQLSTVENDPVGTHTSNFMGIPEQFIRINKTFTQNDFHAFPDPSLQPGNIQLNALTSTSVHNDGYILNSQVNQLVNLVNASPQGSSQSAKTSSFNKDSKKQNVGDDNTTPLDSNLSSYGELSIILSTDAFEAQRSFHKAHKSMDELNQSQNHTSDNLFGVAAKMIAQSKESMNPEIDEEDTEEEARALFKEIRHNPTLPPKQIIPKMNKLARMITANPRLLYKLDFRAKLQSKKLTPVSRQHMLYILSVINHQRAAHIMVKYTKHEDTSVTAKAQALMAMGSMLYPTSEVASFLTSFATSQQDMDISIRSLYALGSVAAKLQNPQDKQFFGETLLKILQKSIDENDDEKILHAIHAVGNAGPSVVALESIPLAIFFHPNARIRAASAHALRKHKQHQELIQNIVSKFQYDSSLVVRSSIPKSAIPIGSDFPFNKSYTPELKLGGKVVNADFQGELFAGTNFDCNQQYFNYEALAQATCTLNIFSWSKQALLAEAVYGRENGQALADEIKLTVWDDVIYDKPIPSVDCSEHTYDIAHTSPGFSVSYTLWVSVIPVTFSAGATLNLDLKWGWQICDSQLLAMIELIPSADLVIDGNAEVDLLIIKAGITLSGQFSTSLIPQGYIHGSECTIGFDVQWVSNPMEIDLYSYYAWKKCKYWIFDCHWGSHNQQTWFSWTSPAHDQTIFNQDWKIQP